VKHELVEKLEVKRSDLDSEGEHRAERVEHELHKEPLLKEERLTEKAREVMEHAQERAARQEMREKAQALREKMESESVRAQAAVVREADELAAGLRHTAHGLETRTEAWYRRFVFRLRSTHPLVLLGFGFVFGTLPLPSS
jgi:hypothetical protein